MKKCNENQKKRKLSLKIQETIYISRDMSCILIYAVRDCIRTSDI